MQVYHVLLLGLLLMIGYQARFIHKLKKERIILLKKKAVGASVIERILRLSSVDLFPNGSLLLTNEERCKIEMLRYLEAVCFGKTDNFYQAMDKGVYQEDPDFEAYLRAIEQL